MFKKMRQALKKKGYTVDEIELLVRSLTELLDKLRKEANTVDATSTVAATSVSSTLRFHDALGNT